MQRICEAVIERVKADEWTRRGIRVADAQGKVRCCVGQLLIEESVLVQVETPVALRSFLSSLLTHGFVSPISNPMESPFMVIGRWNDEDDRKSVDVLAALEEWRTTI